MGCKFFWLSSCLGCARRELVAIRMIVAWVAWYGGDRERFAAWRLAEERNSLVADGHAGDDRPAARRGPGQPRRAGVCLRAGVVNWPQASSSSSAPTRYARCRKTAMTRQVPRCIRTSTKDMRRVEAIGYTGRVCRYGRLVYPPGMRPKYTTAHPTANPALGPPAPQTPDLAPPPMFGNPNVPGPSRS